MIRFERVFGLVESGFHLQGVSCVSGRLALLFYGGLWFRLVSRVCGFLLNLVWNLWQKCPRFHDFGERGFFLPRYCETQKVHMSRYEAYLFFNILFLIFIDDFLSSIFWVFFFFFHQQYLTVNFKCSESTPSSPKFHASSLKITKLFESTDWKKKVVRKSNTYVFLFCKGTVRFLWIFLINFIDSIVVIKCLFEWGGWMEIHVDLGVCK